MGYRFDSYAAHQIEIIECRSGETGRRAGLRIQFPKGSGGSSPLSCTKKKERNDVASEAILTHVLSDQTQLTNKSPFELSFQLECARPDFGYATIIVPHEMVTAIYNQAARSQQHSAQTYGFHHSNVPLEYIKKNFKENLTGHIKELLFNYCVINFLYEQIRIQKLVVSGDPRLISMTIAPDNTAKFVFELSMFPELSIYEWKYFPFKAPKRKNYKDLDRQVESFIEDEKKHFETTANDNITVGDWVHFDLTFADENNTRILDNFTENFWFKLGEDETESPMRNLFLGKQVGDSFVSNDAILQEYFSDLLDTDYNFLITIHNAVKNSYFCFDLFKRTFRIKTNKDMHRQLIEVFSYRNDVSQRYTMVEEALHALLTKHTLIIPNHLILRQKEILLDHIQHNPDYNVYRVQKDFQEQVHKLAKKQITEMIFLDKLAYHENLTVSDDDIKGFINLSNRPRMKEFIYFDIPLFKSQGQAAPVPAAELKRACLREKAINFIIYHLTKK